MHQFELPLNTTIGYAPNLLQLAGDILSWLLVIQILGFITLPLISYLSPKAPDKGYGISKAVGLLIISYIIWLLTSLEIIRASDSACRIFVILLGLISIRAAQLKYDRFSNFLRYLGPQALKSEAIFIISFISFAFVTAMHPEIFWGEKPMDFSFLNYFTRLEELPPEDPWAAGQKMNYYYLGTFIYAFLHKVSGVNTAIGYNLSLATLAAVLITSLYSLFLYLTRSSLWAIFCAIAVALSSNFEFVRLSLFGNDEGRYLTSFDLFWAGTRGLKSPAFAEHPIWSILFADLHAHLISIPFTISLIYLAIGMIKSRRTIFCRSSILLRILYGLILGNLFAINSWDFVAYSIFTAILLVIRGAPYRKTGQPLFSYLFRWFFSLLIDGVIILGTALLCMVPFFKTSAPGTNFGYGFITPGEFNSWLQLFGVLGQWLIPLVCGLLALFIIKPPKYSRKNLIFLIVFSLIIASIPILLALPSVLNGISPLPTLHLLISSAISGLAAFFALRNRADRLIRLACACTITSAIILTCSELYYLNDRMNTIFKFYNPIWNLLAIAALALIVRAFTHIPRRTPLSDKLSLYTFLTVSILPIIIVMIGGASEVSIMTSFRRIQESPRPTLNGMKYLRTFNPEEERLIWFLRDNIKGTPTILEAYGNSYGEFTRIAMNTGLPTVLGWDYHVKQRATPWIEVERRKRDIAEIYSTLSAEKAFLLLARYQVQLIIVSKLERNSYPNEGIIKFSERPDLFSLVFASGDSELYIPSYSPLSRSTIGLLANRKGAD